ncbi:MAG: GNAT family N-acetyltransferase [Rhodospirillales bacterium]|nr:GNAT family N-acetyltransferase [Rhodospirillales bacterium]
MIPSPVPSSPPPLLRLRSARVTDAPLIAEIYVEGWRQAYPGLVPNTVLLQLSPNAQARQWAVALARQGVAESVVVAERANGRIVGFGSCGEARATRLPQAGEIFTLYVASDAQEQGVGRAVLWRLFDTLLDRGLNSALVWVLAGNPARFFYESMGARRIAERTEHLWNTDLPQVAFGWDDLRAVPRDRSPWPR